MKRLLGALLASAVVATAVVGSTGATTGNLPGGTPISVSITAPSNGAVLPLAPVNVTGTADVGTGVAVANTLLVYVVDVSGSTQLLVSGSACGNRNSAYDSLVNSVLDCELAAVQDVNNDAVAAHTVAKVAAIGFAGELQTVAGHTVDENAQALDLDPASGDQTFVGPNDGASGGTSPYVYRALASGFINGFAPFPTTLGSGFDLFTRKSVGASTNYWAAITRLHLVLTDSSVASLAKQVVFISDGDSTEGGPTSLAAALSTIPLGTRIDTFAIGNAASCTTTSPYGDLQDISQGRGTCQHIADPNNAPAIVAGAVASQLVSVQLNTDGGGFTTVSTSPATPHAGPYSAGFSQSLPLAAGPHTICAKANGTDGGGANSVQDCVTVTLVAPPVVTASDASGDEGSDIPVTGTATSDSHNPISYHWSAAAGAGVSPTATCTFADPAALSTTVNCTDDGTWTLTLTVDDHANDPVPASSTLTVANVAPSVTIDSPADGGVYAQAASIALDASFTDPGSTDTHTCTISWGDDTTDVGTVVEPTPLAPGSCQGTHVYPLGGGHTKATSGQTHHITVSVTDDDNGDGSADVTITSDAPPLVSVSDATGAEGSPIDISGEITDNGPTHQLWQYAPGPGVDAGATCSFGDENSAATTVTCTDDGTYQLTLLVGDDVNGIVSASGTLTVTNVAPSVSIASPAPATYAQGTLITLNAPIGDPGSNDTFACTIDWGDGSTDTGVVSGGGCQGSHTYTTGGAHTINVTVTDDDGGSDSASTTITSDAPPVVSAHDASGNEGAAIPVSGSVTDDGSHSLLWTATPGAGVDGGASCTFADKTALSTTVTCTDDGSWAVQLTADDGVNPPVSVSGTLTVSNVAPSVTIATPAPGSYAGTAPITLNAPFTDPGSNDTQTCTTDWGDGTTDTSAASGSSCQGTHTYSGGASHTIKVTVTDDDGGAGSASVTVTSNQPPVVTVPATASGNEGAAIALAGAVTDDGPDTLAWTFTAGVGVDPGATCTFASPAAASTTVKCTDDGTYTVTLTADDHVNPPVSASGTLTVSNVAPSVTITKPAANALFQSGGAVALHATFTDPGANDSQTCSVDWGDGSVTTGAVSGNACDASHSYSGGGSPTIKVTVTDDDGGTGTASVKIKLNQPPDCTHATASPSVLWPPDHDWVLITVSGVTDPNGNPVDLDITGVTQDEPINGRGDGDTDQDARWAWKDWQVWVRAERSDYGNGRVYRIAFKANDGHGGSCTGVVKVGVPHDRHGTAVDNPSVSYDSFGRHHDPDKHERH